MTDPDWLELLPSRGDRNDLPDERFRGLLVREAPDPRPSILMRFLPWKLEMDDGSRLDVQWRDDSALMPFLGRRVIIEGRLVRFRLEGYSLVELTPRRICLDAEPSNGA